MSNGRSILRLKASAELPDDSSVDVGVFDVLLPCRFFSITHKVAELGRVSMTTEYLLRLVRAADGIDEEQVRAFFGFNLREMAFVLAEATTNDYVQRIDGRLWLTTTGRGLFRDGSDDPQIFDVEKRTERVSFDLFSLAPQERESLGSFERSLPELQVHDASVLSNVSKGIPAAFRRHYAELAMRRDKDGLKKRGLYSVDDVAPGDRFSAIVSVVARSSAARPDHPEPDLSGWRSERELDDRAAVVESVVNFLDGLRVENRLERASAYDTLIELAPEFLKEFTRRDGLAVERFYREAIARAGEFRSDRPTIPLVGPLFTRENNKRLQDALAYASRTVEQKPDALLWVLPDVPWGLTRVLPLTLERIVRHIAGAGEDAGTFHRVAIRARGRERHIAEVFTVVDSEAYDLPIALELLVIPKMLIAALIHAPVRAQLAFPVPLGVMSFEPEVVARAETLLLRQLSARAGGGVQSFDYERTLSRKPPPQP